AQAGGVLAVHPGERVDLPDHRTILLGGHATLGDVAVGPDADVQEPPVGAGGHGLGPVVVDVRRQLGDGHRRAAGLRLALAVVEPHHRVLVGHVDAVVDHRQAVGRI